MSTFGEPEQVNGWSELITESGDRPAAPGNSGCLTFHKKPRVTFTNMDCLLNWVL